QSLSPRLRCMGSWYPKRSKTAPASLTKLAHSATRGAIAESSRRFSPPEKKTGGRLGLPSSFPSRAQRLLLVHDRLELVDLEPGATAPDLEAAEDVRQVHVRADAVRGSRGNELEDVLVDEVLSSAVVVFLWVHERDDRRTVVHPARAGSSRSDPNIPGHPGDIGGAHLRTDGLLLRRIAEPDHHEAVDAVLVFLVRGRVGEPDVVTSVILAARLPAVAERGIDALDLRDLDRHVVGRLGAEDPVRRVAVVADIDGREGRGRIRTSSGALSHREAVVHVIQDAVGAGGVPPVVVLDDVVVTVDQDLLAI